MENILHELASALECPLCFNRPKPDTTTVGMCLSGGHMTCQQCAERLINTAPICPVCRQPDLKVIRGHKLAVSIIQILTAFTIYQCKHPTCDQHIIGSQLSLHERVCVEKPVCCPRHPVCAFKSPVYHFLSGAHAECVSICTRMEQSQTWNFVVHLKDVFSYDTCNVAISHRLKPVILAGVLADGFVSHAYIYVTKVLDMAVFYVGWMNVRAHVEDQYKHAKYTLSVYTNTIHGRIGQFVSQQPRFEGEKIDNYEDGLFVSKHTLFNWTDWTKTFKCHECFLQTGYPHVHVEVKKPM